MRNVELQQQKIAISHDEMFGGIARAAISIIMSAKEH
jgi:hypothetical protein